MKPVHFRSARRNREALAIRADVDLLALLCDQPPPSEVLGCVGVLYVRGPIEHHDVGVGDSYERVAREFYDLNESDDVQAIVLCVDSPGGVVSGLNETVYSLRDAKTKPVYAFANEMATSAAYALACVADEIFLPPSAVVGSVGVISTMASQYRADQKEGIDFVTITSGARKADGHPHVPISDEAILAETVRVKNLATQFYKIVEQARGLSPKVSKSLEAGIFLGSEAVELGLADGVLGFDELVLAIHESLGEAYEPLTQSGTLVEVDEIPMEDRPMLKFRAEIAKLTKKLAAETNAKKRTAISAKITKLLATSDRRAETTHYRKTEEEETVESDEEEEEEEEGGNETDREEESEEDEKKAEDDKDEPKSEDDDKDEPKSESDDDKDGDMPEKKEKKAAKALTSWALKATGARSMSAAHGKLAALVKSAARVDSLEKRLASIESERAANTKHAVIRDALRTNAITPSEAKTLNKKPMEYIAAYLDARPKSVVLSAEDAYRPLPHGSAKVALESGGIPEASISLSSDQEKMLADVTDPKLREAIMKNWSAKVNGAGRGF